MKLRFLALTSLMFQAASMQGRLKGSPIRVVLLATLQRIAGLIKPILTTAIIWNNKCGWRLCGGNSRFLGAQQDKELL